MHKLSAFVLFFASAALASAQGGPVTLHVGDPAPPLAIAKWAKGAPVTQLGHGNINVVEFWATWCGPCKQSIPHLTELAKKYKGQATFVGVDSFEHVPDPASCYSKVEKFVTDMGESMNYHVAIDGVQGKMAKTWMEAAGQDGIPTAFVVGRDGKIAWIGHPMNGLDEVVGKMVSGSFDEKAEAEKQRKAQEQQEAAQAGAKEKQQKLMAILKPVIEAGNAKDYRKEVAELDKVMDKAAAVIPQVKQSLEMAKLGALSQYDPSAAASFATQMAKGDDPNTLNGIAWAIVQDNSQIKAFDPSVAVAIAKRADELSKHDPMIADTLALAYFRAHKIANALATQEAAVQKASATPGFDGSTLKEMKDRLAMYKQNNKP